MLKTITVMIAVLALSLTMIGNAGAAPPQRAAAEMAGSPLSAVAVSTNDVAAALKNPRVAAEAKDIRAQMQDPAVVAQARHLLDTGAFTLTTEQSDPRYLSVGGCGFLRLCIYFNRTEQRYIAAGSGAAVAAAICLVGTPPACVVAAALVAIAAVYISDRGGICSGRLRVQILPYPGRPRCV